MILCLTIPFIVSKAISRRRFSVADARGKKKKSNACSFYSFLENAELKSTTCVWVRQRFTINRQRISSEKYTHDACTRIERNKSLQQRCSCCRPFCRIPIALASFQLWILLTSCPYASVHSQPNNLRVYSPNMLKCHKSEGKTNGKIGWSSENSEVPIDSFGRNWLWNIVEEKIIQATMKRLERP